MLKSKIGTRFNIIFKMQYDYIIIIISVDSTDPLILLIKINLYCKRATSL